MVIPNIQIGEGVREVIRAILRVNPQIQRVRFIEYDPERRQESRFALSRPSDTPIPEALARAFHHNLYNTTRDLGREQVLSGRLTSLIQKRRKHLALGFCSWVVLYDDLFAHVPMLNFQCKKSEKSLDVINFILRAVDEHEGVILETNRSYHYYGFRLLSPPEWDRFLGRCLLSRQFVDNRYIGHTLQAGFCVLRLTAAPTKPGTPKVIRIFQA